MSYSHGGPERPDMDGWGDDRLTASAVEPGWAWLLVCIGGTLLGFALVAVCLLGVFG